MPYSFETQKTKLPRDKDRRVKLTNEQRREIQDNVEGLSQRKLAAKYGVSRRLISFILDPAKAESNKQRRKERGGWRQYYIKEEHTEAIRNHRRYKAQVLKQK